MQVSSNSDTTASIRVLIADDHAFMREGLVAFIGRQADMRVVAQAADGREVVELFAQHQPDVTVMDLRLGDFGGLEALKTIRRDFPEAKIIVLSMVDTEKDIFRCMEAGARGYLLKDGPVDELVTAIRAVHAGQIRLPDSVAQKLCLHLTTNPLTPAEQKVLDLMATGKRNGEIARCLYIAEGTVKTHVKSILAKLRARSRTEAVSMAIHRGLLTVSPPPRG